LNVINSPIAWFSMCKWHKCLRRHLDITKVARSSVKANLGASFGIKANWMNL